MRLIVGGGGTAGHITPVLAVASALRERNPDLELLWVGQAGSMEARIVASAGIKFASIKAGKFRRFQAKRIITKIFNPATFGLNARDSIRVVAGIYQSIGIIRKFKPNVIFIKGGYVGLPLGIAASWLRVPYVIHESDLIPGLANKILARRAAKVAVGFPTEQYPDLSQNKLVFTGNPVRPEFLQADPATAKKHFGFKAALPVVLVTGGSQGSRAINKVVVEALPQLVQNFQIIHLTGEGEIEAVKFQTGRQHLEHPERYKPYAYLSDNMADALAAADVVISRAGATTISELALLGKPTILVPIVWSTHQLANAQMLARAGAVRLIGEDRLTPDILIRELTGITGSNEEQEFLINHLRNFAAPNAAELLADEILKVVPDASRK